jgi:hypothetical protein
MNSRFSLLNALREALFGNKFTMPVADIPVTCISFSSSKRYFMRFNFVQRLCKGKA